MGTRKTVKCTLCSKDINSNEIVYVDKAIMVPFCSIEHAKVFMAPTPESFDKWLKTAYINKETEVHCTLCDKVMTGDTLVYVVDNDTDSIFCSMECIEKLNPSLKQRYIRKLTAEDSLRRDSYIDTGDKVATAEHDFLIVESINDYIVINLDTGKVDRNGYEDTAEIQADFDRLYGKNGYLVTKSH